MKTLQYKNTHVSFVDYGKGTPVVLLHGFLENKKMWQPIITKLSKEHRIITLDLLGHGQTTVLGAVHTMEENAQMLQSVLFYLGIQQAVFIGHSMGGYVALAFAEMHPEQVLGLVLLNSTAKADSPERQQNRDRAIVAVQKDAATFIKLSIANLFDSENRMRLQTAIETIKQEALQTPTTGVLASLRGMKLRKDRSFVFEFGQYPKLLILGEKDPVLPYLENKNQIYNTSIQSICLSGGHMSLCEDQEKVVAALIAFLEKTQAFSKKAIKG